MPFRIKGRGRPTKKNYSLMMWSRNDNVYVDLGYYFDYDVYVYVLHNKRNRYCYTKAFTVDHNALSTTVV